jgi:hypothetical protein
MDLSGIHSFLLFLSNPSLLVEEYMHVTGSFSTSYSFSEDVPTLSVNAWFEAIETLTKNKRENMKYNLNGDDNNITISTDSLPSTILGLLIFLAVKEIKLREEKEMPVKEVKVLNNKLLDKLKNAKQKNLLIVSSFSSTLTASLEDENLCPICCSYQIDAWYIPCKHEGCHRCLIRNMQQNSNLCFMCKILVESWEMKNERKNDKENLSENDKDINSGGDNNDDGDSSSELEFDPFK